MKEHFLEDPQVLDRLAKDAEILMSRELSAVKGGGVMRACSCCCTEKNGGSRETEKEN